MLQAHHGCIIHTVLLILFRVSFRFFSQHRPPPLPRPTTLPIPCRIDYACCIAFEKCCISRVGMYRHQVASQCQLFFFFPLTESFTSRADHSVGYLNAARHVRVFLETTMSSAEAEDGGLAPVRREAQCQLVRREKGGTVSAWSEGWHSVSWSARVIDTNIETTVQNQLAKQTSWLLPSTRPHRQTAATGANHHLPPPHRTLWSRETSGKRWGLQRQHSVNVALSAEQTPEHILQVCPFYEEKRCEVWTDDTSLHAKLWGHVDHQRRAAGFDCTGLTI